VHDAWTHATWTVTPGRESDFVQAWKELGDWTLRAFPGAHGTLLRDSERPNVFSASAWPDKETVARWRASSGFQDHLAVIRETLERFEPLLLGHVVTKQ
jgi:heme-degrading monooxygenase HmoA